MSPRSSLPPSAEEPALPALTAASVAKDYFQKELQAHVTPTSAVRDSEVVVILHDACYGHRYARPRTSKASLNTIVERPERIQATVLGVSAAYVRLGGHHSGGRNAPHPRSSTAQTVPFRVQKSSRLLSLLSPAVTQVHGLKWMAELKKMCEGAEAKLAQNGKELVRPMNRSDDENDDDKPKLHEGDLYLCAESLSALEGALGGVCDAVDQVFEKAGPNRAFVCVRPPGHHCSADYPSGFCWLNNVHVGVAHASMNHRLTHAAIIDFDLHHGDGSQAIAWAHNAKIASLPKNATMSKKTAIGYFSLHDINSYPCEWGDEEKVRNASLCLENAHGQTIWNVHLQPWKNESEFWEIYESRYSILLSKTRDFLRLHCARLRSLAHSIQPRAAIFISAGFDASEWESPGMQRHKVNVPTDFYARFTRDINNLANEEGLGVQGRVISVLEGGYSDRALTSGVLSHLSGLTSSDVATAVADLPNGLGHEMGKRLGKLSINSGENVAKETSKPSAAVPFDPQWWKSSRLEELEALVNPPEAQTSSKKPRNGHTPTYTSSTQSFSAKIVTPPANRRSSSSNFRPRTSSMASSRPPSPPPPEVNWATAAHEMCKLLVPSDRQTGSCKPEDLNAEATRTRRNRQSVIGLPAEEPTTDGQRMQLRDRKSKTPNYRIDEEEHQPQSKSDRRKTFGGAGSLDKTASVQPSDTAQKDHVVVRIPPRRRVSVASSVLSTTEENEPRFASADAQDPHKTIPQIPPRRSSSSFSVPPIQPIIIQPDVPLVKKGRASTKPRSPSKTRVTGKTAALPPAPRVPSALSKSQKPRPILPAPTSSRPTEGKTALADKGANGQEVENLTSGMKKMSIKLNVPPKEEQVAREGKPKPATRAPRKSMAPKASKNTTVSLPVAQDSNEKEPSQSESVAYLPIDEGSSIKLEHPTTAVPIDHLPEDVQATLPPSFLPPQTEPVLAPVAGPIDSEPQTLPTQSSSLTEDPNHDVHELPVHSPPIVPTVAPPSTPKRTRDTLPLFTSSSPIPFAKPNTETSNMNAIMHDAVSNEKNLLVTQPSNNPTEEEAVPVKLEAKDHESLWSVPDRPQQRIS